MNELDKLKDMWHDDKESATNYYSKIKDDVLSKAQESSKDISRRIKKNIRKDIIINILSVPIFILFLYLYDFNTFTYLQQTIVILILITIYSLYLAMIINLSKKLNKTEVIKDIKESIRLKISVLYAFMKRLKLSMIIGLFFGFFFGFYLNDPSLKFDGFPDFNPMGTVVIIVFSIMLIIIAIISYAIYKAIESIYHSFYGQYLKKLKAISKGLEENEDI